MMSTERLARELRQAESVNAGLGILNSDPGKLVLEGVDLLGNPRTVVFYLSSGTLMLSENGVDTGSLSRSDARVSSLVFFPFFIPSSLYYDNFWHGWADSQTAKDGFPISSVSPELLLSRSRDRRCGL